MPKGLQFAKIRCDRCGDPERLYGYACGTCQRKPGPSEVNEPIRWRQRMMERVVQHLSTNASTATRHDFAEASRAVYEETSENLTKLGRAVQAVCDEADDAELKVTDLFTSVSSTRALAYALIEQRPHVSRARLLRALTDHTFKCATEYVEVFRAESIPTAQASSAAAQAELDRASERMTAYDQDVETAELLNDYVDLKEALPAAIRAMKQRHPASTVIELNSVGERAVDEELGIPSSIGGLDFLLAQTFAKVYFNTDKWYARLALTQGLLNSNVDLAAKLLGTEELQRVLTNGSDWTRDAIGKFLLMLQSDPRDETVIKELLNLYGSLIEDSVTPLYGFLLLISGTSTRPFQKLIGDSADVARRIRATPSLRILSLDRSEGYRNAASHGHQYFLDGDDVVFELTSFNLRVPIDELLNDILELMELSSAMQLPIEGRLSAFRQGEAERHSLGLFEPSAEAWADMHLSEIGIRLLGANFDGHVWTVDLRRPDPIDDSLFALACALSTLMPAAESMCIRDHHDTGQAIESLTIKTEAIQRYSAMAETDGALATISAMFEVDHNGSPLVNRRSIRSVAASLGFRAVHEDRLSDIPALRAVRQKASDLGDEECQEFLNETLRRLRLQELASGDFAAMASQWMDPSLITLP